MATEFHSTDQNSDGTTDGDLYYCEPCKQYVHYTFTVQKYFNQSLVGHRDHYLSPESAQATLDREDAEPFDWEDSK